MIRLATLDDINILVKFRINLLKETCTNIKNYDWDKYSKVLEIFYYENIPKKKIIAFLAEENGNIISVSIMYFYNIVPLLYNLDGKIALLTDMYTIPKYRSKGIGTLLLNTIMKYTKDLGYIKVILNATPSGRKLYEKYGFKDVNGEMCYKFT